MALTYVCEQYLLRMKQTKSESRFRLTQAHLSTTSEIAATRLKIQMKDLLKANEENDANYFWYK